MEVLDGLRAVSVLSVVAYHLGWYGVAQGGFLGVDVFFVVSGFLITSLLISEFERTGTINIWSFLSRRAKRLLPALYLLLLLLILWAKFSLTMDGNERHQLHVDTIATLGYVFNWRAIFSGQSYFEKFASPSMLRHMWSLAVEEQYYVVWPAIAWYVLKRVHGTAHWQLRLIPVVLILAFLSSAWQSIVYQDGDPSRSYYGTDCRAHELLIGAGLSLWRHSRAESDKDLAAGESEVEAIDTSLQSTTDSHSCMPNAVLHFAQAAALSASFAFVSDADLKYYHGGSMVFSFFVAWFIHELLEASGHSSCKSKTSHDTSRSGDPMVWFLTQPVLCWIGRLSYSLYLWHWPVFVVLSRFTVQGPFRSMTVVLISFGCASCSLYLFEKPMRSIKYSPRRVLTLATLCMLFLAGASTLLSLDAKTGGLYMLDDDQDIVPIVFTADSVTGIPTSNPPSNSEKNVIIDGLPRTPSNIPNNVAVDESSGTVTAAEPDTTQTEATSRCQIRLSVVGDSVARSLVHGLAKAASVRVSQSHSQTNGRKLDISLFDDSKPGCGVASGFLLTQKLEPIWGGKKCGPRVTSYLRGKVSTQRPDVIVWYSGYEIFPRRVNGSDVQFGDTLFMLDLLQHIVDHVHLLSKHGSIPLLFIPIVPPVNYAASSRRVRDESQYNNLWGQMANATASLDEKVAFLQSYGLQHVDHSTVKGLQSVQIVDIMPYACASGIPCKRYTPDGRIELRHDGFHFNDEGSAFVASPVMDAVINAACQLPNDHCTDSTTGNGCGSNAADAAVAKSCDIHDTDVENVPPVTDDSDNCNRVAHSNGNKGVTNSNANMSELQKPESHDPKMGHIAELHGPPGVHVNSKAESFNINMLSNIAIDGSKIPDSATRRVILSASVHRKMEYLLPVAIQQWKDLNYEPFIVLMHPISSTENEDVAYMHEHWKTYNASLPRIMETIAHYDLRYLNISTNSFYAPSIAGISRYIIAASQEFSDDYIVISDVDLIPLGGARQYLDNLFHTAKQSRSTPLVDFVYSQNEMCAKSDEQIPGKRRHLCASVPRFRTCYLSGSGASFAKVLVQGKNITTTCAAGFIQVTEYLYSKEMIEFAFGSHSLPTRFEDLYKPQYVNRLATITGPYGSYDEILFGKLVSYFGNCTNAGYPTPPSCVRYLLPLPGRNHKTQAMIGEVGFHDTSINSFRASVDIHFGRRAFGWNINSHVPCKALAPMKTMLEYSRTVPFGYASTSHATQVTRSSKLNSSTAAVTVGSASFSYVLTNGKSATVTATVKSNQPSSSDSDDECSSIL
jgi:peptidoglycan/LPS O-acetylase OafA/YrhL